MSGKKKRRSPARPPTRGPAGVTPNVEVRETGERRRPSGPLSFLMFGGAESTTPSITRSLGRGVVAVAGSPVIVVLPLLLVLASWLGLLALGLESSPARLVDLLAIPPIGTYFDVGTGAAIYGLGTPLLVFIVVAVAVRSLVQSVLTGMIVEALEGERMSIIALLRGLRALPTLVAVNALSFSLIVVGNMILPFLGAGLGFIGFMVVLVGGLLLLGFAPAAAVREGRPAVETIRRAGRAAMLPGSRQMLLAVLYFFLSLPVVVGFAPGSADITANPTTGTWVFVLVVNLLHLVFMAAFAYRWIALEPTVPEQPLRRRAPASRTAPARGRR